MHILLIEDNEGDIELTGIAFKRSKAPVTLSVAHDGAEALELLSQHDAGGGAMRPDLILLDLNMPRMGGRQFLEVIKKDEKLRAIPVIILTSSNAPADIMDAYARHANCYILKPFDFDKFVAMARQIYDFWGTLVRMPIKVEATAA
jgi:two-component system response regulator